MDINQVLDGIKKGRTYARPRFKFGKKQYQAKLVSINGKPYIWEKTQIPGIFSWFCLGIEKEDILEQMNEEDAKATDWVRVSRPAP